MFIQQLNFYATTLGGVAPAVLPNVGVLLAPGPGLSDSDLDRFNFVQFTGFYTTAACYIYSVTDLRFDSTNCLNQNLSAGFGMFAGSVNTFGMTSPYTTIGTGTGVAADITWYGGTAGLGSFSTNGSGLLLVGVQGARFRDGVFAAGATGNYINIQGNCQSLTFDSIELNTATVTLPSNVFFFSSAAINGIMINNMQIAGQYTGLFLGGGASTFVGAAIVGQDPSVISGGFATSFSHLP
jgi:hypothetical protein